MKIHGGRLRAGERYVMWKQNNELSVSRLIPHPLFSGTMLTGSSEDPVAIKLCTLKKGMV